MISENISKHSIIVLHGRNERARLCVFEFLRALKLDPLEEESQISNTGSASPFFGEILKTNFDKVRAAIVLLTPDPSIAAHQKVFGSMHSEAREGDFSYHPTADALIEAGMSLGLHPNRTILVKFGNILIPKHLEGRSIIDLSRNDAQCRIQLIARLKTAGYEVDDSGTDWISAGDFTQQTTALNGADDLSRSIIPVDKSYITILTFAKLIHHEFHTLHQSGCHNIGVKAKDIFNTSSGERNRSSFGTCIESWAKSASSQESISSKILQNKNELLRDIREELTRLISNTSEMTHYMLATCLGNLKQIETGLNSYQSEIESLSTYFNGDGGLSESELQNFGRNGLVLDITLDRLVNQADLLIKHLIIAIEYDRYFL